jgi:hypothetical protein
VDLDLVSEHFETLHIRSLPEWDVLAFIYRHGTSLASAEQIARLLGYPRAAAGAALDTLTTTGLVQRSRNSHGVRLYHFAPAAPDDGRWRALEELIKIAGTREGRLLFIGHLRCANVGKVLRGRGGLHLA